MTKCLEGGSCTQHSLGLFHDDTGHNARLEIMACTRCGLAVTLPEMADVAPLYENRASREFAVDTEDWMQRLKAFFFRREAREVLGLCGNQPAHILDFGCGEGRFTSALAMVTQARVTGSDFETAPPPLLQGPTYAPYARLEGSYDLVIARHVLEHFNDPLDGLAQMKKHLAPGGCLFIEVPNRNSPWTRIFGKYWDLWYVPFHRVHFTRTTLERSLQLAGFDIVCSTGAEMPSMGRTLRNYFGCRYNIVLFAVGVALQPLQLLVAKAAGEPACLRIVARLKPV